MFAANNQVCTYLNIAIFRARNEEFLVFVYNNALYWSIMGQKCVSQLALPEIKYTLHQLRS